MSLSVLSLADHDAWTETLARFPDHDTYHLFGYQELCTPPSGHTYLVHLRLERSEYLLPITLFPVPDAVSSKVGPFYDAMSLYGYPGPLRQGGTSSEEDSRFAAELRSLLRELQVLSLFIRASPLVDARWLDRSCDWLISHDSGATLAVDLQRPSETRLRSTSQLHRRNLRRLETEDVRVEQDHSSAAVGEFSRHYLETMRRRGAGEAYFLEAEEFHLLLERLGAHCQLWTVRIGGRFAAGALLLRCNGTWQYHLGATAADASRLAPLRALFESVSELGFRQGDHWLHLGGGIGGARDDGVFRFKESMATDRLQYVTFRGSPQPEVFAKVASLEAIGQGFFPVYRSQGLGPRVYMALSR